jgi:hypothetical protein
MSRYPIDTLSRNLAQPSSRRSLLQFLGVGAAGAAVTAIGVTTADARKNNKGRKKGRGKGKGNKGDRTNIGPFKTMTGIPLSAHEQGKNFKGTLDIVGFEVQDDAIVAIGTITGKVTGKGNGNKPVSVEDVVIPVELGTPTASEAGRVQAQAVCDILDLVLGPIDLTLLGLRLQVNQIHIQLTGDSTGGLLGSLLCPLLDPLGPLEAIVDALNQILAVLQGL